MPLLAYLVDIRHDAVYGSVFAICQIAVCLAYSMGEASWFYLENVHLWGILGVAEKVKNTLIIVKSVPIENYHLRIWEF